MTLHWQGRDRVRLGTWLPNRQAGLVYSASDVTRGCASPIANDAELFARMRGLGRLVAIMIVAAIVILPSTAFAQDSNDTTANPSDATGTTGGTVRVRAVDNTDVATNDAYSAVASRAMPSTESADAAAAPSNGDLIVSFALQFVGYPYVWAGNSPAGFDCSGFTQYVILNTLGIDIGHGLEGQPGAGAWIDSGALLPGDIVFFQNTYQPGLSHVGIYIGDGMFVHAENEGTGVVISALWSDYYGPRYWGAVRVG